jgi:hypothetical protein
MEVNTMSIQIAFPAYVLVTRSDKAATSIMDLPGRGLLHVVTGPCRGADSRCLPWFTTASAAKRYVAATKLTATVVAVENIFQAMAFLGTREFSAVLIDPEDADDRSPILEYEELLMSVRDRLDAAEPPRTRRERTAPSSDGQVRDERNNPSTKSMAPRSTEPPPVQRT